jgi:putative ABC transport system permease protein
LISALSFPALFKTCHVCPAYNQQRTFKNNPDKGFPLMRQLLFYLQYAARNLWRDRRWSAFGLFSVAAGVATIVALRSLGLAINDTLTSDLRESLKGDLMLTSGSRSNSFGGALGAEYGESRGFTETQLNRLYQWAEENNATVSEVIFSNGAQVAALDAQTVGRPQFINLFYIDPETYPVTEPIRAIDPAGVLLADLFQGGNEIVISENLAADQDISVGDHVRVSGTEEEFIVRGIVATETQAGLRELVSQEMFSVLFGYAYLPRSLAGTTIDMDTAPNRIYIGLPEGQRAPDQMPRIENEVRNVVQLGERDNIPVESTEERLEENAFIADILGRFIVIMGLGAMLIGGVGITNTMLVIVRRRTGEIAALKTFGVKGRQVASMFMAEAFWLGLFGSLIGCIVGVLLGGLTNRFGEAFIQQSLPWRLYPEAILFGLVIGLLVSVIFGVLPVIAASRVRPAIILRPSENYVPAAGIIQSLFAVLFLVVALGLIAGQIIGSSIYGVIFVAVTLAILAILVLLLWLVVWLIGKLPSFGFIDFKLALRNLSTRRIRTATTLLALATGMFALSSIAFFGSGLRDILNFTLTNALGGNVLIFPLLPSALANPLVDIQLRQIEGVESITRLTPYSGVVLEVDGTVVHEPLSPAEERRLNQEIEEAFESGDFGRGQELIAQLPEQDPVVLISRDVQGEIESQGTLIAGRFLTPEDRGQPVAVVAQNDQITALNIGVGSMITVDMRNTFGSGSQTMTFEVVGVTQSGGAGGLPTGFVNGDIQIPSNVVSGGSPIGFTLAQIDPEQINPALVAISNIPLVFAFDISFFDAVLSRLIQYFSAVPILVGILSLAAAAVIMANTVALATQERRRQIGILKAIGLKADRVLRVMILENVVISLLGGVLGIGFSALGVYLMNRFALGQLQIIPTGAIPITIGLVIAAVAIGTLATFFSASVAVRERVLNILRYE